LSKRHAFTNGFRMITKISALAIVLFALKLLSISSVYAYDTYHSANGSLYVQTHGKSCTVIDYGVKIDFAPQVHSIKPDGYFPKPSDPKVINACAQALAISNPVKILKAVPSKAGTRRTRDITATTYTDMRVPDTVECEGAIIKKYQTNKNWHKVQGLNVTTLCGEY